VLNHEILEGDDCRIAREPDEPGAACQETASEERHEKSRKVFTRFLKEKKKNITLMSRKKRNTDTERSDPTSDDFGF
jgi:hypothetical protein